MNKSTDKAALVQSPFFVVPAALLCTALWGSAFPGIKIGYQLFSIAGTDTASQILFAGMRFALAGIMVVLFRSLLQRRFLLPSSGDEVKMILLLGMVQTIAQYICFYIGLANATGVSSSILSGTNALVCSLVAALVFRQEKLTGMKVLGCLIGFGGVLVMNLGDNEYRFRFLGEGLIFCSIISYAFSSSMVHIYSKKMDPALLSGWQFVFGGTVLISIGWLMGGRLAFTSAAAAGILVYLAFLSAMAYSLWSILLKYNPVSNISVFTFMTAVFGVFLSALLLHESIADRLGRILFALLLTTIGIFTVQERWKQWLK